MKKILLAAVAITLAAVAAKADGRSFMVSGESLVSILIGNNVKPSVGSSSTLNSQNIVLEGGVNLGHLEFGPRFSYFNSDDGTTINKVSGFGAYGRYNFVENKAGVGVVPFALLKITKLTQKNSVAAVSSEKDVFGYLLAGGATFFPINDVIGINGQLQYANTKESVGSIDTTTSGFALATSFNLYF